MVQGTVYVSYLLHAADVSGHRHMQISQLGDFVSKHSWRPPLGCSEGFPVPESGNIHFWVVRLSVYLH